jgi:peptidoglycan/LPS O-acetylase OafA/YrhL
LNANPGISTTRTNDRPPELPALTSLRGLAALTVLLYHSSSLAIAYVDREYAGNTLLWIWSRGYLAVDLFFMLSGFVLTHVYRGHLADARSGRAVSKFLWARFSRIYPASIFTTAVFVLASAVKGLPFPPGVSFTEQLIASLFLMQVPWLDTVVINAPSWSISAEFYAYLLFLVIAPMICRARIGVTALLGAAILLGIITDHAIFSHEEQTWGWGALLRALPEFVAGILAYQVYCKRLLWIIWEKDVALFGVSTMMIAALFVEASDGVVVPLFVPRLAGVLALRPLRWLGEISYSVYIFQTIPLMLAVGFSGLLVAYGLGGTSFTVLAAMLALGSGILVHRCVDLPVRAALARVPGRVMAFVTAYHPTKTGPVSLTPLSVSEHERWN